jgi:hypothetical protein
MTEMGALIDFTARPIVASTTSQNWCGMTRPVQAGIFIILSPPSVVSRHDRLFYLAGGRGRGRKGVAFYFLDRQTLCNNGGRGCRGPGKQ